MTYAILLINGVVAGLGSVRCLFLRETTDVPPRLVIENTCCFSTEAFALWSLQLLVKGILTGLLLREEDSRDCIREPASSLARLSRVESRVRATFGIFLMFISLHRGTPAYPPLS